MFSGAVGRAGRSPSARCTPTSKPAKNARHASGTDRGSFWYCANIWSMYSALARLTKSAESGVAGSVAVIAVGEEFEAESTTETPFQIRMLQRLTVVDSSAAGRELKR